jgi:hypothetical protein
MKAMLLGLGATAFIAVLATTAAIAASKVERPYTPIPVVKAQGGGCFNACIARQRCPRCRGGGRCCSRCCR